MNGNTPLSKEAFDWRMIKKYYQSLDGLRAVAVLIVMAAHAGVPYIRSGGVGVDIFFVLSGYLITSILSSEAQYFGRISFRNFYARRVLRLAPCLLLTCAFFTLWCLAFENRLPLREVGISLFYVANWARALYNTDLSALAHTWSLGIEEQFYLLWPLVILLLERLAKKSFNKALFLFGASIGLALYRYCFVGIYSAQRIYFGLDTHMDGLVMGGALYYFLTAMQERGGLSSGESRVLGYVGVPGAFIALLVIIKEIIWVDPQMGRYGFFVAALASTLIIADLVAGEHSLTKRFLSRKPAVFIGRISYGLYLWHFPLYHAIDYFLPETQILYLIPLKFTLSLLVASASYYLVERRFLQLKSRFERNDVRRRETGQVAAEKVVLITD